MEYFDCVAILDSDDYSIGLVHEDVFEICRKAEFVLCWHTNQLQKSLDAFTLQKISIEVLEMMESDTLSSVCSKHSHGFEDLIDGYRLNLIKQIIKTYLELRIKDKMQRLSHNLHEEIVRHVNKRLTIFKNQ